jgi:hypothetical protein
MKIIIEYQYYPPSILFKSLVSYTHLIFEQYENFQKMSFRNRLMLAGGNGPILLSIPLKNGRNQKCLTKDVLIDNRTSWQSSHWKTIVSCYNRSPWFEFYRDELHTLYKTPFQFLVEWNSVCFKWALNKLNYKLAVSMTEQWKDEYDLKEWNDWRNKLSPGTILTRFPDPPKYAQVFSDRTGFLPHLSILDLLFCEGKNARAILDQQ